MYKTYYAGMRQIFTYLPKTIVFLQLNNLPK